MKTIIAGSRTFNDYEFLKESCKKYNITQIISGTAKGADVLGERYAKEFNIPLIKVPADWSLGKKAGYLRNVEMSEIAEQLIAFNVNHSKGTEHMINIAKNKKLNVIVFEL
jgi:hypothetical protein